MQIEDRKGWLDSYRNQTSFGINGQMTGTVLAVSSGKGGVGKTTISLKLAERLAIDGKRVLLVDCDFNLSNTGVQLGLPIKSSFIDLLSSRKNFYDCIDRVKGFELLMACNGNSELFESSINISSVILDIVSTHKNEYDVVILDCPAGLNSEVLDLCAYADLRLMVANPDVASITDTYSSIKVLKNKFNIKINHLLVNRATSKDSFLGVVKTISETAERFLTCQTKVLGAIFEGEKPAALPAKKFFMGKNFHAYKNVIKELDKFSEELVQCSIGSGI